MNNLTLIKHLKSLSLAKLNKLFLLLEIVFKNSFEGSNSSFSKLSELIIFCFWFRQLFLLFSSYWKLLSYIMERNSFINM